VPRQGGVPQNKLRPHLNKCCALLLKLLLLALQRSAELLGLLGLPLHCSVVGITLLLHTMQGILVLADARPRLVQGIAEAIHHRAQVLILLKHLV
jgi:hypothetical protein